MIITRKLKSALITLRPSKVFQRFDQMISRKKLGHGAGYTNYLRGKKDIANALSWNVEMTNAARIMRNKGFAEIPSYDEKLMSRIRIDLDAIINDESKSYRDGPSCIRIKLPEINLPIIRELITEDVLKHFRAYYGTEVKVMSAACWRIIDPKQHKGKHIYSNWWHFDATNTAVTKLFVAVSDISKDHGPFHIYPLSSSKNLIKKGYVNRQHYGGSSEFIENGDGLYRMTGRSGKAIIGNTEYCLHKAGEPLNGNYRDIICFQFLPSKNIFEVDWFNKLIKKSHDR